MEKQEALKKIQAWLDAGVIDYDDFPKRRVGRPPINGDKETAALLFQIIKHLPKGRLLTKEGNSIVHCGRSERGETNVLDGIENLTNHGITSNQVRHAKKGGPRYEHYTKHLAPTD